MMRPELESKWDKLFDELVPCNGKCECVAGELIRAGSKVCYRYNNDGDMVGVGYGKETCNPAARYLVKHGDVKVRALALGLWHTWNEKEYEKLLDALCEAILEMIETNPDLRNEQTEDMWDCATGEDKDDSWYDEYEEDGYEDEYDEEYE